MIYHAFADDVYIYIREADDCQTVAQKLNQFQRCNISVNPDEFVLYGFFIDFAHYHNLDLPYPCWVHIHTPYLLVCNRLCPIHCFCLLMFPYSFYFGAFLPYGLPALRHSRLTARLTRAFQMNTSITPHRPFSFQNI